MNLQRLEAEFGRNFDQRGDLGASVSIWRDGVEVAGLGGGFQDRERTKPWVGQTPVLFWSATKGPSCACLLHACQEAKIPLERRVADVWPEFGAEGKEAVTIAEVLSHRGGLPALSREVSVLDYDSVIEALALERPSWHPGDGHGYHPRTFGFLLDEILRRVTGGTTLRSYWDETFARPLNLDLWIGMPANRANEVAPILPARRAPAKEDPFYKAFTTSGSLTSRSFASPKGLHSVGSLNTLEARMMSFPAFGGVGSARSLAKFYAMLANGGGLERRQYFHPSALEQMSRTLTNGTDRVLQMETAFSAGFMKDPMGPDGRKLRMAFGPSQSAFGHPGAGGSHAFADPENRMAFAYVMNQMEPGVLPGERSLALVAAAYET